MLPEGGVHFYDLRMKLNLEGREVSESLSGTAAKTGLSYRFAVL